MTMTPSYPGDDVLWWYRARYVRNFDGDTVDLEIDQGFGHRQAMRFRMLGIDAPEKRTTTLEAGKAAQAYLEGMLRSAAEIRIRSHKDAPDKYGGRWLAEIFVLWADGSWANLNARMIEEGHAVPYAD